MNGGLSPALDLDALSAAVELLDEAGFAVEGVDELEREDHGVEFSLRVSYPTRVGGPLGEDSPTREELKEYWDDEEGDA